MTKSNLTKFFLEFFVVILLFGVLFAKEVQVVNLRQIDTTMFMETIANTRNFGLPWSPSNKASRDVIPTFTLNAEKICETDLTPSDGQAKNILENHAYYVVYLLSPLSHFIDVKILAPIIHVLIYVVFIWLVFRFLGSIGVDSFTSLLFCILVMCTPNWSMGVQGQYYFDRLYIPVAFYIAVLSSRLISKPYSFFQIIILITFSVFASTIHERAALMVGVFLLLFSFLYRKDLDKRYSILLSLTAGLLIAYAVLITFSFTSDVEKSNTAIYLFLLSSIKQIFLKIKFQDDVLVYLFVNLGLFGFLGLWSKRYLLIAIITMLPSIILSNQVSITGWLTHYHTYYFPFLVFAAANGYAVFSTRHLCYSARIAIVLIPGIIFLMLVPYAEQFSLSSKQVMENAIISAARFTLTPVNENPQKIVLGYLERLNAEIPHNATVSTSEGFFPALYPDRVVFNFPIGLGVADYLVLSNKNNPNEPVQFYTAESFLGVKEKELIDACLNAKIANLGYDVKGAKRIGNFSVIRKVL